MYFQMILAAILRVRNFKACEKLGNLEKGCRIFQ